MTVAPGVEADVVFQLLGPVQAVLDGRPTDLGTRQRRFVLAVLLLEVNRLVPVPRLMDLIWPDDRPEGARGVIHTHISRLKKALAGFAEQGVSLRREGSGYVLHCDPMRIDAHRFLTMLDQSRTCTDDEQRVVTLNDALGLWQGPALGSVTSDDNIRNRLCRGLEEARLVALEDRFDAELRLRRHHAVVDKLTALTAEHPNRQRLVGQLMLALYRSQRTEDALEVYRRAEQRMAEEAGLDLANELKELQLAILRDDPDLRCPADTSGSAPAKSTPVAITPRQLPLDVDGFTGRDMYLRHLEDLVASADEHALAIVTIEGTAGVGKTALAIRWAHRLAEQFTDGQLFINLRGYGPGPPVSGTEALAQFLRALGVDPDRIPHHENERSALYRSLLADRRVLMLLDNAVDVNQVRLLLPGSPSCLVLITSRDRLSGLVAMQGAHQLTLDVLNPDESAALLTRLLGWQATQDQPTVAALAGRLAHLPLALRIAAANLLNHPRQTVANYAAQLRDIDRLDALVVPGDEQGAVRVAFDHSYRLLDGNARRLFRLLGLHPGNNVDVHAAAALAGVTLNTVRQQLDRLTRAHLIHEVSTGRFQMHDLLRVYAAEQACADESKAARRAALTRLLDFYLHVTHAAMDLVYPNRRRVPLCGAAPETELPTLTDYQQAMMWLDSERANLVAATRMAASEGWSVHAWQFPHVLYRFFYVRGYIDDWISTHDLALTATARSGDRFAEAETLNNLGSGYLFSGRYAEARDHYQRALTACQEIGDRPMEATTLSNLALLYLRSGRYAEALDQFQQALMLHRQVGDQPGEARTLNNLGLLLLWMGRHADAIDHCHRAVALARQIGYHRNEAAALDNLGVAFLRSGKCVEAITHGQQALAIFRQIGDRRGEAAALDNLGTAYTKMDRYTKGLRYHDEALTISRELHIAGLTCEILNHTGTSHRLAGHHRAALDYHTQAFRLAHETGERHEEARAHEGIARTRNELGHRDESIQHWRQAVILYTELGVPEAHEARSHVDELTDRSSHIVTDHPS